MMFDRNFAMEKKLVKMLRLAGGLYVLSDILELIAAGKMQSWVEGTTWAVTQVHDFPQKRVLDIAFVVGDLGAAFRVLASIEAYALEIGADMITAMGRPGWDKAMTPGWVKKGHIYVKVVP